MLAAWLVETRLGRKTIRARAKGWIRVGVRRRISGQGHLPTSVYLTPTLRKWTTAGCSALLAVALGTFNLASNKNEVQCLAIGVGQVGASVWA